MACCSGAVQQKRLFHVITALITTFATIAYYALASGDGRSYSVNHYTDGNGIIQTVLREVYWARYIDWVVTTPLLLLDLALLAGVSGANILVIVVADIIMVLTGLFAAYGNNEGQKWGYYTIGIIAYLFIIYHFVVAGRHNAAARDSQTARLFNSLALFTIILWTLYPIVWAVGDGSRKISVDGEIIAYAVLDLLAKSVFGFWLLISHDRIPSSNVILDGVWTHGFGKREGAIRVGDDDEGV
jgi:bacteriorhodopsin